MSATAATSRGDALAVPPGLCLRCGRPGPHLEAEDCIRQLRDELADAQMGRERAREEAKMRGALRELRAERRARRERVRLARA